MSGRKGPICEAAENAGSTFSLLWNTGTNAANTIGDLIGFSVAGNDTGGAVVELRLTGTPA